MLLGIIGIFIAFAMHAGAIVLFENKKQEQQAAVEAELYKRGCKIFLVEDQRDKSAWTCPSIEQNFTLSAFQSGRIKLPPLPAESLIVQ